MEPSDSYTPTKQLDLNQDPNRLLFAYWVPNVSGGLVVSTIEQRTGWDFEYNKKLARIAENSKHVGEVRGTGLQRALCQDRRSPRLRVRAHANPFHRLVRSRKPARECVPVASALAQHRAYQAHRGDTSRALEPYYCCETDCEY